MRETHVIVMALASELEEVAEFVRKANRRHHLKALLVHADLDERWIAQMLDRADLRTLRNLLVHRSHEQPRRVLDAWKNGSQDDLIADAVALGDRIIVLTCALERIEVPWHTLRALENMKKAWRTHFEIASDGSYIHWPDADVHLDVEALRVAIDPKARQAARLQFQRKGQSFGRAIARLRKEREIRQTDIPGLSARHMRRIEGGEVFPRTSSLEKLAEAHDMALASYLDELANLQKKAG
ncbi:MAG: hypothetical protein KAI66_23710 [Lentisphaeria bacterium]|nr:hypothetical protein [Lentisphaeria bacterium]